MRVALVVLSPVFASHTLGLSLVKAMQDQGDEVVVAVCDGLQARCLPELSDVAAPRGQRCQDCMAYFDDLTRQWTGGQVSMVSLYAWLSPEILSGLADWLAAVPDEALPDVVWQDWPVGRWGLTGLQLERFGEFWQALPDWPQRLRLWLRAIMAAALAMDGLTETWRPEVVVLLDGALPVERAVWEAAKRRGIRTVLYEGGQIPGSWILRDETPASQYDFSPEWAQWRDVPLSQAERRRLAQYLSLRFKRQAPDGSAFSPPATGAVASLRQQLQIPDHHQVLAAFTSVSADAPSLYAAGPFSSQLDWLDACVALAGARSETLTLVIRIHPAEGMFQVSRSGVMTPLQEPMAEALGRRWPSLHGNVRIIGADDPVSSYDLMALADLAVVYISTLALEAVAMGKPAIVAGRSHYAGRGIVPSPRSSADLAELVDQLLAQPMVSPEAREWALRYLYLWFFRANVQIAGARLMPWADRQIVVPGDSAAPDPVLARLCDFVRGEGDFLPLPAPWRPRDRRGAAPLPEGPARILFLPAGMTAGEVAEMVMGPSAWRGTEVVVVTGETGWAQAVALCEAACRSLGAPEAWPVVRLLPPDVPEADWLKWLLQVDAVVCRTCPADLRLLAEAAGVPCLSGWAEADLVAS